MGRGVCSRGPLRTSLLLEELLHCVVEETVDSFEIIPRPLLVGIVGRVENLLNLEHQLDEFFARERDLVGVEFHDQSWWTR